MALVMDALISLKRAGCLLTASETTGGISMDGKAAMAVNVTSGVFEWESPKDRGGNSNSGDVDSFRLEGINLRVPRGALVGICGAVGAGKSSLMEALIGEMRCVSGSVVFGGSVSYCPQKAWIQNVTVRDNILFGSPLTESATSMCSVPVR
jgi:ATP-binding cassette, subfamily C (CFTR/MRP), member 1